MRFRKNRPRFRSLLPRYHIRGMPCLILVRLDLPILPPSCDRDSLIRTLCGGFKTRMMEQLSVLPGFTSVFFMRIPM
jgi:hypothetical protein